ncbi:DUF6354 family protein [Streptomyces sp. NPDC005180]|uniref:DUF6354 family protein n=1 Tax=Streptomyces sp. NPDC005180 TaxID=3156868 RepID=UPI0033BF2AE8
MKHRTKTTSQRTRQAAAAKRARFGPPSLQGRPGSAAATPPLRARRGSRLVLDGCCRPAVTVGAVRIGCCPAGRAPCRPAGGGSMAGTVTEGQLYRDMAPDMKARDRRLRVLEVGNSRARLLVEHDLGGTSGKTTHASLLRLTSRAFELIEDTVEEDPRYLAVLAAISEVHHPDASPADYTRAALRALHTPTS